MRGKIKMLYKNFSLDPKPQMLYLLSFNFIQEVSRILTDFSSLQKQMSQKKAELQRVQLQVLEQTKLLK